jgi:hypothetical protein
VDGIYVEKWNLVVFSRNKSVTMCTYNRKSKLVRLDSKHNIIIKSRFLEHHNLDKVLNVKFKH